MKRTDIIREYGVVIALSVLGIAGYLWYDSHREDVLSYSLDTVGGLLTAMVEEGPAREAVAERFGAFKARVLNQEVAPAEVERLAANVLNLHLNGAKLTEEEAQMVLSVPPAPPPPPAPGMKSKPHKKPPAPPPADAAALEALGERLATVVRLREEMNGEGLPHHKIKEHVTYRCDDGGLRIAVDAAAAKHLAHLKRLKEADAVAWEQDVAREVAAAKAEAARSRAVIAAVKKQAQTAQQPSLQSLEVLGGLHTLEQLAELQALGYRPNQDSLAVLIERIAARTTEGEVEVKAMEAEVEALHRVLERMTQPAARRTG